MDRIKLLLNKYQDIIKVIIAVLFYIAVAFFGASLTDTQSDWYQSLTLPKIQPPSQVFMYVWSFLYLLLAVITSILILNGKLSDKLRNMLIANGILNVLWSYSFFTLNNPAASFVILSALIVLNYYIYGEIVKINPILGYLFILYIAWLVFAIFLNYAVLFIN